MTENGRSLLDIERAWRSLPASARKEIESALENLPGGFKGWGGLIDEAMEHFRLAAGAKGSVAIVGPANVGKSTLYNALIRPSEPEAEVSAVPGTTREVQSADAGVFTIVDTPGTDAVGKTGESERTQALSAAAGADIILLLFDAASGIGAPESELHEQLLTLGVPMVVALNKIDLVRRERTAVQAQASTALRLSTEDLYPISALRKEGLEALLLALVREEPEILAALGEALPAYRRHLSRAVIARAASAAGGVALTPLPFIDFIPLLGIQVAMVVSIARIHSFEITRARAREIIATFGAGTIGRTAFYGLSRLGGPPTWLVAAGVAAATTATLGYAAVTWFEQGERITDERFAEMREAFNRVLLERLRGLGRRRPGRVELRREVDRVMDEMSETEPETTTENED